jgi:succinate dehydrogenase / fumarate reductase, membrane anchor subunit
MLQKDDFRAPLARVRGWGSAKQGSAHWWALRLTSVALVPLSLWFVFNLIVCLSCGDYARAVTWLQQPVSAALMALFLVTGFHHGASGLQTVIEDYVHYEALKLGLVIVVKFLAALLAVIGLVAVGKIAFGG